MSEEKCLTSHSEQEHEHYASVEASDRGNYIVAMLAHHNWL